MRCRACGQRLAPADARLERHGAHEHTGVNPHGFVFVIACYGQPSGCVGQGTATTYWSWFPGYAWRIALCRGCLAHVGWLFRPAEPDADDPPFAGFIQDRIEERDEPNGEEPDA